MQNASWQTPLELRKPDFFAYHRQDEEQAVQRLLASLHYTHDSTQRIAMMAQSLVQTVRQKRMGKAGIDTLLVAYSLSSEEGIALMCMAEALLRIPDSKTRTLLIRDKLAARDWHTYLGKSDSLLVNAATYALMLTGKVLTPPEQDNLSTTVSRLLTRTSEPVIRRAVARAMRILGNQFVMGETIELATKRARIKERIGYRYSYDMLGESALTQEDAARYFEYYLEAIAQLSKVSDGKGPILGPGISVKLSALHPRYDALLRIRVHEELYPRLKTLALRAKEANIGFTIDAEESHRLTISLEIMERLISDPELANWQGLGLAIQAYQKRALLVVDHIIALARQFKRPLMVRLVKGAYWDTEIKDTQVMGYSDYPVFTRKAATDVSYLCCAEKLLAARDVIYPQFATHNAHTVAAILDRSGERTGFEFQCLHGMGEALYDQVLRQDRLYIPVRIYAPVGSHSELLAYLVRRLLENGANSSFVNRIVDARLPIEEIIADPIAHLTALPKKRHSDIPVPAKLFRDRKNSEGLELRNMRVAANLLTELESHSHREWTARPTFESGEKPIRIMNPANPRELVGLAYETTPAGLEETLSTVYHFQNSWNATPVEERAKKLIRFSEMLEEKRALFITLLCKEAGKTLNDALSEVREAVDFCRYYAAEAEKLMGQPMVLPGPTGERNTLSAVGRGLIVCISPWNFPLAIFLGQIAAALVTGNTVIAKPAPQTPLIADLVVRLLHQVGVPKAAVALVLGGPTLGEILISDLRIAGVMFTGSTATAKHIAQNLIARPGPLLPLIAETGGQNAMIVDSSALCEQVVQDVVTSAFLSAGQRCSALRVLYVQEEVADKILTMLTGALAELSVGVPTLLSTDIGPVIDQQALEKLLDHTKRMEQQYTLVAQVRLSLGAPGLDNGYFFAPRIFEIPDINVLEGEVFGPILHVVRFKSEALDSVIDSINATGFGLTLGIHSRIDATIQKVASRANVGNLYVNRNMVGAVVGVQPFGGEGLSGTGPKAGGPHYLLRLVHERTLTVNTVAQGGNAALMSLSEG